MPRLRKVSGLKVIKVLTKHFGFVVSKRSGSHVTLFRYENDRKLITVVPLHRELKIGTLKGILKLGAVSIEEFSKKL